MADYALAKATSKQLVRIGDLLVKRGVKRPSIENAGHGWALYCLLVGHSAPATHAEATKVAIRYANAMGLSATALPPSPRLHFGSKRGGLVTHKAGYKPTAFARGGCAWRCEAHDANFSKCGTACRHGMRIAGGNKGDWLYKAIIKAKGPKKATLMQPKPVEATK